MDKQKKNLQEEKEERIKKQESDLDQEDIIDVLLEEDWTIVRNLDLPRQNRKRKITGRR